MVYEFEELYIARFIHMFKWWKNSLLLLFAFYFTLFYISTLWWSIWFIDYKERNVDLCFGEKYTYKRWFAYICIIINKVYMVATWSNSFHTIKYNKIYMVNKVYTFLKKWVYAFFFFLVILYCSALKVP